MSIIDYFFVEKHNERVRNFWHDRLTTISCRVESTIKGAARPFGLNIVALLYNECLADLRQKARNLYQRDYNLIQRTFGLDRANLSNHEQYLKALEIRDLTKSEVWSTLGLIYIGSARILGFHKELFYLKCLVNDLNPQFILRCLYFMKASPPSPTREIFNLYRNEIAYLLDNIMIPDDKKGKSSTDS
jgi:hypothetical protein